MRSEFLNTDRARDDSNGFNNLTLELLVVSFIVRGKEVDEILNALFKVRIEVVLSSFS